MKPHGAEWPVGHCLKPDKNGKTRMEALDETRTSIFLENTTAACSNSTTTPTSGPAIAEEAGRAGRGGKERLEHSPGTRKIRPPI